MKIAHNNVLPDASRGFFNARRRSILQAARKLLLESGESSLTIELIAKAAELGKGTVYNHFQSKTELYVCLLIDREHELLLLIEQLQDQTHIEHTGIAPILPMLVKWKLQSPSADYEFSKLEAAVIEAKGKKLCDAELLAELKALRMRSLHSMTQMLSSGTEQGEEAMQYHLFLFTVLMNGITYALNTNYTEFYQIKENSAAELERFTKRLLHQVFNRNSTREKAERFEHSILY